MSATLCSGPPCFRSVCGMPLQTAVYIISLVELVITVILTTADAVKYSRIVNNEDHQEHVYIGPIIVNAQFGFLCSILLFVGARMRHRCLLISWMIIFLGERIKYLYVVIVNDSVEVNDWTIYEDWLSISLLAYTYTNTLAYTAVTAVVISFTKECGTNNDGTISGRGVDDYGAPPAYKA